VLALSGDGTVLLGRSASTDLEEEGFLLRIEGFERIPLTGGGGQRMNSQPQGVTSDLSTVVGKTASARGPCEAARWTATDGWIGLGDLEGGDFASQAMDVSGDGRVIVGWGSSERGLVAVRWVDGELLELGDLPGGAYRSAASLVSSDGLTVAGTGTTEQGQQAFVWRVETGFVALGDLEGGALSSEPFAMTPDGSVVVGEAASHRGIEAFRWTADAGIQSLGDLSGGEVLSRAFAVSADGTVVAGAGHSDNGSEAFVWDSERGFRKLIDVLRADQVPGIAGWMLTEVTGLSADGRILAGNGTNAEGETEGWVARLP
jgi:uncharacterized membrane protein